MAQRAVLYDRTNRKVARVSYREIDDYVARGLVERLTPINAKLHCFRLVVDGVLDAGRSSTTLTASISCANAGAADTVQEIHFARRKVRAWPKVGDTRAVRVACRTHR